MSAILTLTSAEELAPFAGTQLYRGFDPATLPRQRVDAHVLVLDDDGVPAARASLWWKEPPPHEAERVGAIGHYAACDEESGVRLLAQAAEIAREHGCTLAVGPLDGNTWRTYRLVTQRGTEAPFFLEPDNPDDYPAHFARAGFAPLARYTSALETDLTAHDARLPRIAAAMSALGVTIRPLDANAFDAELARIHAVSLVSFRRNLLYTPIPQAEFVAQYSPLAPHVRPELVLIAEAASRPVGFAFALPDLAQVARGVPVDTAIIKTVAVLPGRAYAGLGILLAEEVRAAAHELGFTRAIHALMHDSNGSRNISARYGTTMRRYTLYGRGLAR
jgi:GNAT superfamily N-acetyltransferase